MLRTLVLEKRGLILLAGATGTGKSTTLASMLEHRNQNMTGHILTIEDPMEFVFYNKKSVVNQREVGRDTHPVGVRHLHPQRHHRERQRDDGGDDAARGDGGGAFVVTQLHQNSTGNTAVARMVPIGAGTVASAVASPARSVTSTAPRGAE